MTARKPPRPDGLNKEGTGRGLKKVTRPVAKKRGVNATEEAKLQRIADNRAGYKNLSNLPVAEVALLDDDKPLTEKAKLFVRYWAQGESITSASARAGYGDGASYAYKLVHLPKVKALYDAEKKAYEEAGQMSRKKVMDMLIEAYDMAKLMAEPASMVSAAREVGKMCGYYEPVKKTLEINVNGATLAKKMDQMSDAELQAMIVEGMTAIAALEQAEAEEDEA